MDLTENQIAAICEWARGRAEVLEVRLYGSRAKGTSSPQSDIDLALSLETGSYPDQLIGEYRRWAAQLSLKVGHRVHVERYADNVFRYCQGNAVLLFKRR